MSLARYAALQNATASPREIEQRAFRYVNGLLSVATDTSSRIAALHKTHELWSILISDLSLPGNALPPELKARLISLGLWAQREALARMADDRSLTPLVELHRDMIAGLDHRSAAPHAEPVTFAGAVA